MSPDPFGALTVERLDTSNYLIWAPRMEYFLTTKGLWEAVTTDDAPVADCRKARAIIGLCVTSQHLATIQRSKTAKEAWDSLAAIFKTKGTALKLRLRRDLSSFKMAAGEPLTKYFARAKALQDKLLESFPDFKEEDIFWPTVQGLPSTYDTILTIIENTADAELTLDSVLPKLMQVEQRQRGPDRLPHLRRPLRHRPTMSPDPFGALTVERLDTSNYLIWAPRMEYFLTTKGLWEAVTTDDAPVADCRKARAIIGLCVTSQHLATIQRSKTAKEAWDSLAAIFKTKGTALKLRLRRDLSSFKMAAGEPLTKYFARAKALQDKLLESFPDFKEEDIFWPTVQGLPSTYDTILTIIENTADAELTLDSVLPKLMQVEQRQRGPDRLLWAPFTLTNVTADL
ncbi:with ribonuclease H-like and integrase domains isoform B [Micractinium conductrix]|nr:with ribonuclease H-like and integrase domains isoform B [Micractinium conductrix]|eukprot:PSC76225.1 with ribonuclease H-like and integrase domains isoform B [Micractinium conductrix]